MNPGALLVFILCLPGLVLTAAAQPPPNEAWVHLASEHFTLMSNAGSREAARIAADLEGICAVMAQIAPGTRIKSPVPTQVFVFKDTKSFDPYRLGPNGKPEHISGYFQPGIDANFVCIDASAGEEASHIAYHEFIHILIDNNFRNTPQWLNEGLAEYYSTFEVDGDKARIGRPISEHVLWLRSQELMSLDDLFQITVDSPDYHEGERQGVFYAESWALTHCIMMKGRADLTRPGRLLEAFSRGLPPPDALNAALGLDTSTLDDLLVGYVSQSAFDVMSVTLPRSIESQRVSSRPMTRAEVLFQLGDLLAHRADHQKPAAEKHLNKCLELEGSHSGALVSLGFLADRDEDAERAAGLYRQATEGDWTDWRGNFFLGLQALGRIASDPGQGDDLAPRVQECRQYFERSLTLNPEFAPSRAGLGRTYLFDNATPEKGIALLSEAAEQMPSREDIVLDLVVLTARAGKLDDARKLLDQRLRPTGNLDMVEQAEKYIEQCRTYDVAGKEIERFNVAVEFQNRGQLDSAAVVFGSLAESASDSSVKRQAVEAANRLQRAIQQQRAIESYNEGVEAANAGDLLRAKRLFQEVLELEPEPELRSKAEEILQEIDLALKRK